MTEVSLRHSETPSVPSLQAFWSSQVYFLRTPQTYYPQNGTTGRPASDSVLAIAVKGVLPLDRAQEEPIKDRLVDIKRCQLCLRQLSVALAFISVVSIPARSSAGTKRVVHRLLLRKKPSTAS